MHLYLYDAFLYANNYSKVIDKIENRLTDLGIKGPSIILDTQKKTPLLIDNELKKGINTIAVIGDDQSLNSAIQIFNKLNPNILTLNNTVFGIIPINNCAIAKSLGIPQNENACEVLVQRRVVNLDIGCVNEEVNFLANISFHCQNNIKILLDHNLEFNINNSKISVVNLPTNNIVDTIKNKKVNTMPNDGRAEIIFEIPKKGFSLFKKKVNTTIVRARNIKINGEIKDLKIGEKKYKLIPKTIKIKKQQIKFVVGKDRKF